jgi:hypothetical protein
MQVSPSIGPPQGPSATGELAALLTWVRAARVIVIVAAVIAAGAALMLIWRGRRLDGLMIGTGGVTAAVIAQVIIAYVAWRAHEAAEKGAPRPTRATGADGRSGID